MSEESAAIGTPDLGGNPSGQQQVDQPAHDTGAAANEQTTGPDGERQQKSADTTDPGVKRALAELRRRERETRAELDRERAERQALMNRFLSGELRPANDSHHSANDPKSDGAPDPAKYAGGEFSPDFIRDMARHEARAAFKAEHDRMTKAQYEDTARRQRESVQATWTKSVTDAQGKYSDFEVIVEAAAAEIPQQAKQMLIGHKDGAELLYIAAKEIAKDPKKAASLSGNPIEIAVALGRLAAEAQSTAKATAQHAAQQSAANEPIRPGTVSGLAAGEPNPAETDRWIAWRKKQIAAQGGY